MASEQNAQYIVSVQGIDFTLDKSQIEFDSPNYFTTCFSPESQQARIRHIELPSIHKAYLFRIIADYLCGYCVLPLSKKSVPATVSLDAALCDLRQEASFFRLNRLIEACDIFTTAGDKETLAQKKYLVLGAGQYARHDWHDDDEYWGDDLFCFPTEASWQTYVNEKRLAESPLNELVVPNSAATTEHIRTANLVEKFVSKSVADCKKWHVLGWYIEAKSYSETRYLELLVVLRNDLRQKSKLDEHSPTSNQACKSVHQTYDYIPRRPHSYIHGYGVPDPTYCVSLRGVDFILTRSLVEVDAPNYFTAYFSRDFQAQPPRIELDRNPDLFRIITIYLCGYSVLPLSERAVPATMPPDVALTNLHRDAIFYQLDGLANACDELIKLNKSQENFKPKYLVLEAEGILDEMSGLARMMDEVGYPIYDPFFCLPPKAKSKARITQDRLAQEPLNQLQGPSSAAGRDGLYHTALVEKFISKSIEDYNLGEWRLIGWHIKDEYVHNDLAGLTVYTYSIVVKDLRDR